MYIINVPKPVYLLDENVQNKDYSNIHVNAKEITQFGTPDDILLEKAIKRNLIVITQDKGFALYAIKKGVNIVYQDHDGHRFYIYGSKTKILNEKGSEFSISECMKRKQKLRLLRQLVRNESGLKVCMSGIYSVNCF